MNTAESATQLKAALKSEDGELDAWLEVHDEQEVRLAIQYLLKEQDRDTRHACAEAVNAVYDGSLVMTRVEIINRAHAACMNAQAI